MAKGFTHKKGVDYSEILSPVVKYKTIRLLLALVAQFNWELEQMDIKTTFLHGELEKELYMQQLEGFEDKKGKNIVRKLEMSLYGRKQSPRQWNRIFDNFIIGIGFERSHYDTCVYFSSSTYNDMIILLIYVDDMLIVLGYMF